MEDINNIPSNNEHVNEEEKHEFVKKEISSQKEKDMIEMTEIIKDSIINPKKNIKSLMVILDEPGSETPVRISSHDLTPFELVGLGEFLSSQGVNLLNSRVTQERPNDKLLELLTKMSAVGN